jgi:hypothetical protein
VPRIEQGPAKGEQAKRRQMLRGIRLPIAGVSRIEQEDFHNRIGILLVFGNRAPTLTLYHKVYDASSS